ncbi:hypothetical protein ACFOVU_27210 [Nocardiopsis sediminis]|uniref:Preprotein translocase subunit SecG n=1 Tax=Nocardiopsis sediminis TaxID=1778267 RepID=A0ABV8FYS4_9ACTN
MSLTLILAGAALVAIALFNRVPALRSRPGGRGPGFAPARLTEAGRATLTTVGGSLLIIAFFLALSGH